MKWKTADGNSIRQRFDITKQNCRNVIISIYWNILNVALCEPFSFRYCGSFSVTFDIVVPRAVR